MWCYFVDGSTQDQKRVLANDGILALLRLEHNEN